jgi:hypothetical protein
MAAIQALSDKYNIPVDQIKIVSSEVATWPNGCLGVVIPSVMCTDGIVDGFRIMLEANGQQFEFRTNQDGTQVIDAAQQLSSLLFVITAPDGSIQAQNPEIPLGQTYPQAFTGFLPSGGSVSDTAYILESIQSKAISVDASGNIQDLAFVKQPTYGLAVWPGSQDAQPRLAWGTQVNFSDTSSTLQIANLDGSESKTVLTNLFGSDMPVQLVAQFWSEDGQSLYYSKEPVGLGGYIPFSGASNLYRIDINTGEVREIIPQAEQTSSQTCLDAISIEFRYVADHCSQEGITIRDLQNGSTSTIQVPDGLNGYRLLGSARFSPDGSQVAYSLAKGNPDDEQGWVAVGDRTGGVSRLILTGDIKGYYTVLGWLNDQTLLVQQNSIGDPIGVTQLFTLSVDGSHLTRVADGTFLAVIDNR